MAKRPTIGDNPIDAYISPHVVNNDVVSLEDEAIPKKKPKQSKKQRITVHKSQRML